MQHAKQFDALGGVLVLTAGLASAATAAEWSVNVNGFFNARVIVSNVDDGYQGKSVYTNPEIFFSPSIKMDNGITYGARVELEGYTIGDQIDEHYSTPKAVLGRSPWAPMMPPITTCIARRRAVASTTTTTRPMWPPMGA